MSQKIALVWLRRDLRLSDNAAIKAAIDSQLPLLIYFNFDIEILNQLDNSSDARVSYIHHHLAQINEQLRSFNTRLLITHDETISSITRIFENYDIGHLFHNRDYEPAAINRDERVEQLCKTFNIGYTQTKDHVIFERDEILKANQTPYTVYTPYMKRWRALFNSSMADPFDYKLRSEVFYPLQWMSIFRLEQLGFEQSRQEVPPVNLTSEMLIHYNDRRNFPALQATSNLGTHLRFGTISVRKAIREALNGHQQFLNELIWREFFMQIIYHFPHVVSRSFKPKYDQIKWENNLELFHKWCDGETGYPLVDAGMRQLKQTGQMHNRVRMVTASFLTKHLLTDWRWGEAWFANHLHDFDQAANNGNWQWAAGCGCDAAPYFRVFNPIQQQVRFDPEYEYCKRWIPELDTPEYCKPIVDHTMARNRALGRYKVALQQS